MGIRSHWSRRRVSRVRSKMECVRCYIHMRVCDSVVLFRGLHVDMMAYMRVFIYRGMDAQHTCIHMHTRPEQPKICSSHPPSTAAFLCLSSFLCALFSLGAFSFSHLVRRFCLADCSPLPT